MRTFIIVAICLLLPLAASANHPTPAPPDGGINWYHMSECSDNETGEKGTCRLGHDRQGNQYLTFWQADELMFIRRILPEGGFETIWTADHFNAI